MLSVLTLVADPARDRLDTATLADAASVLQEAGATMGDVAWLAPDRACDVAFDGGDLDAVLGAMRRVLENRAIDALTQPRGGRRRRVLLADMDSTMVAGETLDEMAVEAGLADQIVPITRRAMNGELDFAEALRHRLALFAGQPADLIDRVLARTALNPGARTAVMTMRAHGAFCQLVSGGFDAFTRWTTAAAGFDAAEANVMIFADGRLTGGVGDPILGKERKLALLRELADRHGVGADAVIAVGDGANDLPMLQAAGLGVAYRAKPAVRAACRARIDHTDLTTLLFFQGYPETAFTD